MSFLDPKTNLDESIEMLLEAPDFEETWIKATWTYPPDNITEARGRLKRDLKQRDEDVDQLDGIAFYVKG